MDFSIGYPKTPPSVRMPKFICGDRLKRELDQEFHRNRNQWVEFIARKFFGFFPEILQRQRDPSASKSELTSPISSTSSFISDFRGNLPSRSVSYGASYGPYDRHIPFPTRFKVAWSGNKLAAFYNGELPRTRSEIKCFCSNGCKIFLNTYLIRSIIQSCKKYLVILLQNEG